MVEGWDVVNLGGISVYHTTKPEHAISILTDGIRNVQSAWGQATLGAGFYTHKDKWGSFSYFQPSRDYPTVILELTVSQSAGQKVPAPISGANLSGNNVIEGNAFLVNGEDENEIKWHSGDSLQFARGWVSKEDPESRSDNGYTEYTDRQLLMGALHPAPVPQGVGDIPRAAAASAQADAASPPARPRSRSAFARLRTGDDAAAGSTDDDPAEADAASPPARPRSRSAFVRHGTGGDADNPTPADAPIPTATSRATSSFARLRTPADAPGEGAPDEQADDTPVETPRKPRRSAMPVDANKAELVKTYLDNAIELLESVAGLLTDAQDPMVKAASGTLTGAVGSLKDGFATLGDILVEAAEEDERSVTGAGER